MSVVSRHVPTISKKVPTNKPPWWTNRLAKAIKQKQQLYSTFRHTHLSADYVAYAHKRNEVKSLIRSAQAKYDQHLIDKLHINPKALYGYMRNKSGLKPRIAQIVKPDGLFMGSDGETAEVLNKFFQSVFISERCCTTEIFSNSNSQLSDITFTEAEVFVSLTSLKPNKASGPDNLHSQVLKIVLKVWQNLFFYCLPSL